MTDARAFALGPASLRAQRWLYGAVGTAGVALWIADSLSPPVFPLDDAYITAHNAAALIAGHDPNYGVAALVGATSPLHLVATALFTLVLPALRALHVVMWLGAIAYALGLLRLAFTFRASIPQALGVLVAGLVVAEVPHHLMNGLETGWAMAGIVWVLALASERRKHARIVAILCGLLPLLRPELGVLSALVLAWQAHSAWKATPARREALRAIGMDVALAVAAALPFIALTWATTGSPIPGTINAKRYFFAEGCLPAELRRSMTLASIRDMTGLLGVMSASVILLALTGVGRIGLATIAVLLFAYYEQFPGALAHNEHRYVYPMVPILLFGAASKLGDDRRIFRWTSSVIIFATCALGSIVAGSAWRRHEAQIAFDRDELAAVAAWTRDHIPPGATVLVHDAGYISYATNLHLVDMVGLKTPGSEAVHARVTWPSCGRNRGKAVSEIARATGAQYLIVLKVWDQIFGFVPNLLARHWQLRLVRDVEGPGYAIYEIVPP